MTVCSCEHGYEPLRPLKNSRSHATVSDCEQGYVNAHIIKVARLTIHDDIYRLCRPVPEQICTHGKELKA